MQVFKNPVGRPPKDLKKKRIITVLVITLVILFGGVIATINILGINMSDLMGNSVINQSAMKYKVNFHAMGGKVKRSSKNVKYGESFGDLPTPTKTGYKFKGWYTDVDGNGKKITSKTKVNITEDLTLYSYWEAKKYKITFDGKGGKIIGKKTMTVKYGQEFDWDNLPTVTKTGYVFYRWLPDNKDMWFSNYDFNRNMTFHAYLEEDDVRVDFSCGGIRCYIPHGQGSFTKTVLFGKNYGTLPKAKVDGYTLKGWYTKKNGKGKKITSSDIVKDRGITLYAYFTENKYKVTFNANGGSVKTKNKNVTFNKNYGALPTPTKTGYNFKGWYTSKDRWGEKITANSKVSEDKNITLYAWWEPKTYTLTLDPNGGKAKIKTEKVEYGSSVCPSLYNNDKYIPTRGICQFYGWTFDKNDYSDVGCKKVTGNMKLYAFWRWPCSKKI